MQVLITGASRGIGKAIADIFLANGHVVLLTGRNAAVLNDTAAMFREKYATATIHTAVFDLSQKENAIALADWTLQFGVPDILVNNAGSFEPGTVTSEGEGVLESQIATNLYSAYHLTRALLPAMIKRKSGHIFNMCSIASLQAYENGGAYSISKFALYGFSKNLREEMKPHGIKVTAILPGAVLTDSWGDFDNSAQRIMIADDIARMLYAATSLSPAACVEDIVIRPLLGDL